MRMLQEIQLSSRVRGWAQMLVSDIRVGIRASVQILDPAEVAHVVHSGGGANGSTPQAISANLHNC